MRIISLELYAYFVNTITPIPMCASQEADWPSGFLVSDVTRAARLHGNKKATDVVVGHQHSAGEISRFQLSRDD